MELIEFSSVDFDPSRILEVRHNLSEHPLLQLPALIALAQRLPPKQLRYNATTTTIHSPIHEAAVQHRHSMTVLDALANIETSGSWIILMNIQTDPEYKALLDEALDGVNKRIGHKDPGMFNRAFWVFIQSPGALTPYHIDHEQNFLMQIKGKKHAQIWQPEIVGMSDLALERFHADNNRDAVTYRDEFADLSTNVEMLPGVGVYMPNTAPHFVRNTDAVSIGCSMTYNTTATDRVATIHRGNLAMRKLGIKPTPIGRLPAVDRGQIQRVQDLSRLPRPPARRTLRHPCLGAYLSTVGKRARVLTLYGVPPLAETAHARPAAPRR